MTTSHNPRNCLSPLNLAYAVCYFSDIKTLYLKSRSKPVSYWEPKKNSKKWKLVGLGRVRFNYPFLYNFQQIWRNFPPPLYEIPFHRGFHIIPYWLSHHIKFHFLSIYQVTKVIFVNLILSFDFIVKNYCWILQW